MPSTSDMETKKKQRKHETRIFCHTSAADPGEAVPPESIHSPRLSLGPYLLGHLHAENHRKLGREDFQRFFPLSLQLFQGRRAVRGTILCLRSGDYLQLPIIT